MILKKTSDTISFRYYSIILIFAVVFLCVPVVIEPYVSFFPNGRINIFSANNSIGSKNSEELFFLPYIPSVNLSYETITGFFVSGVVFVYRSVGEYFRLIKQDLVIEIQKINTTWYQLADGKK